jgi:hypothetical protein
MKKRAPLPQLPPLSREALHHIHEIEDEVRELLESCSEPLLGFINREKARQIVRTYLIEELDVKMGHYSSLPNYQVAWMPELIRSTVDSLIVLMPVFTSSKNVRNDLLLTAAEHLAQKWAQAERAKKSDGTDRHKLRDEYLATFPDVYILDICWAAGQHYSEWKRWLRDAVENGSAPDRAFRAILSSGKPPREYRNKPRPKGWK